MSAFSVKVAISGLLYLSTAARLQRPTHLLNDDSMTLSYYTNYIELHNCGKGSPTHRSPRAQGQQAEDSAMPTFMRTIWRVYQCRSVLMLSVMIRLPLLPVRLPIAAKYVVTANIFRTCIKITSSTKLAENLPKCFSLL